MSRRFERLIVMKILGVFLVICMLLVLPVGCSTRDETTAPAETESISGGQEITGEEIEETGRMKVTSSGIKNGVIDPKYGSNGDMITDGVPLLSLPLSIENAPEGTVCYAIYMDDPDAAPLAGYNWVHWTAVNIETADIPEGFSASAGSSAVQGTNDYGTMGYGGPAPPDKDHNYVITVFALDKKIALEDGFAKDVFDSAIDGHVLASVTLEALYVK